MRVDDPLPFSEGKVHFTCGPSRTEAEHPQPRFGQVIPFEKACPHVLASVHEVQRGAPIADGLAVGVGDCAVVEFCRIGKRRRHLELV